jgi:hypothetical protein
MRYFGEEPTKTKSTAPPFARLPSALPILVVATVAVLTGCDTTKPNFSFYSGLPPQDLKDFFLREAVLKITFPGAANLDTVQTIAGTAR